MSRYDGLTDEEFMGRFGVANSITRNSRGAPPLIPRGLPFGLSRNRGKPSRKRGSLKQRARRTR